MAVTKWLARDFIAQVLISAAYTHIGGLESLTHSPSTTETDTTDWDSNGDEEHLVAQRAESWTLAGFWLEDETTGARDPGQEALIAAARLKGVAAQVTIKLTFPGSGTITITCTVETTGPSGGKNDAAKFQAVLHRTGSPVYGGVS